MKPDDNPKIVDAVQGYYTERCQDIPTDIRYEWMIDAVAVYVDDVYTMRVGLPPVSDYQIFRVAER